MNSGLKLASTPARPPGMFEVMISTAFLKSTVRPWPSVRRPSSITCSRTLKTSVWAFSISSSRIDGVRAPAHGLGELAALLVADVAGRRADQPRDGVLLHVLRHVDADHRVLRVEHELGERAGQLGLADAGRAEEQERADRPVRVAQARARAAQGVGDRHDRLVLADDAPVQALLHVHELLDLALHQAARPGCPSTCRRPRRSRRRRPCRTGRPAARPRRRRARRPRRACARARGSRRGAARRRAGSRARARRARARGGPRRGARRSLPWPSACSFSRSHWARMPAACSRSSASSRSISSRRALGGRVVLATATSSISSCMDAALDLVDLGRHRGQLDRRRARRPRRPGRWPCRAGSGRRCSGRESVAAAISAASVIVTPWCAS